MEGARLRAGLSEATAARDGALAEVSNLRTALSTLEASRAEQVVILEAEYTTRFRDLLAEARRRYDRVILDSPPVGAVTDAAIIAPRVDATVVVVRGQQTHKEELRLAVRQLRDVGARIAGVVLNDLDVSRRSYGYGGYYYQRKGYYSSRDDEPNELHETA